MHPSLRIDSWYQVGILRLRVSFALLSSRLAQDDCPGNWGETEHSPIFFAWITARRNLFTRDPSARGFAAVPHSSQNRF